MNSKFFKSYMAEFIFLLYIFIIYCFKLFEKSNVIDFMNIIFLILLVLIYYFIFGFSTCRKKNKVFVLKIIIIWTLVYYFITYMSGLIIGFLYSPYSITFIGIIKNIIPALILIVLQEMTRYMYIRVNENNYFKLSLITIIFILFDIVVVLNRYPFTNIDNILKFIGLVLLPSISRNFLMTYLNCISGYSSCILYRILFEVLIFILPIFPNFSVYLESVIKITFPILIFLNLDSSLEKFLNNKVSKKTKKTNVVYLPIIFILIILISLVSGIFKYHLIAIGSGSMKPNINVGDAVIIEKYSKDELQLLSEGDLLAFEHDGNIIVHRIEKVLLVKDNFQFVTKGDANNSVDDYIVMEDEVVGSVNARIPYIGLPSVWLHNLFS